VAINPSMVAPMYLQLQVVDAVRYPTDSAEEGTGTNSKRTIHYLEHLTGKQDL
jgi:hypothetical protein